MEYAKNHNPYNQDDWQRIFNSSAVTLAYIERVHGLSESSLRKYLSGETTPREKNRAKMECAMKDALSNPRPEKHPSFGYATTEEIEAINTMGISPDYIAIMGRINTRNRCDGKDMR